MVQSMVCSGSAGDGGCYVTETVHPWYTESFTPVQAPQHVMAERVRVREITNDEGNRLLRTGSGSV